MPRQKVVVDSNSSNNNNANPNRKGSPSVRSLLPTPQRTPRLLKIEDDNAAEQDAVQAETQHDGVEKTKSESDNVPVEDVLPNQMDNRPDEELEYESLPDPVDKEEKHQEDEKEEEDESEVHTEQPSLAARTSPHPLAFHRYRAGPIGGMFGSR